MTSSLRPSDPTALAAAVEKYLACPHCHRPLQSRDQAITCAQADFSGSMRDGVAVMGPAPLSSFFDERHQVMELTRERGGGWNFGYERQTAWLTGHLQPGQIVLDVGCGPSLPYEKPPGVFVIGLEPSLQSIQVNQDVDLRVCGSGFAIPMADASVDVVVCFYSIHHMVGETKRQTEENVSRCFREFGRVLKPGGMLCIFEMTPMAVFGALQGLCWNTARKLAPAIMDMYFWSAGSIGAIGRRNLPADCVLEEIFFRSSAFITFPPVFSLPWFKVPRFAYPLGPKLYKWRRSGP